ncbi:hypothetical protein [Mucilaginibacter aquatilis]|uniref:Lipoprotein n=1 Tax=Mucilaginibacter aquatilis TaxID=1517760 RepID=A0A6I4I9T0_9SPHI|nr:hypothetical protein [Mucilaginibacter aquatilis]MVN90209.1 hypothetical protein [Mucilaginibacter aquatilis]
MKNKSLCIAISCFLLLSSCSLFNRNPNTAQRGKRFPHDSDKPKHERKEKQ